MLFKYCLKTVKINHNLATVPNDQNLLTLKLKLKSNEIRYRLIYFAFLTKISVNFKRFVLKTQRLKNVGHFLIINEGNVVFIFSVW